VTTGPEAPLPSISLASNVGNVLGGAGEQQAQAMRHAVGRYLYHRATTFDHLEVVVIRDPTNPQAVPRLGVRGTGPGVDRVYALAPEGRGYAVVGELSPQAAGLG
jgi:hypothetical protein